MKRVFEQLILDFTVSSDIAGEPVVVEGKGSQPTVADGIVLSRQIASEVIVVQMETAKFHKLFREISGQASCQLISANVKVFAPSQPQLFWNRSSELIGVDIEIFWQQQ